MMVGTYAFICCVRYDVRLVFVNVGPLLNGVIDEIRPSQSWTKDVFPVLG